MSTLSLSSSQRVLTVAPNTRGSLFPGPFYWTVEWGAAAVMLPWHHYQWYGYAQTLRDNFGMICRFTDYVGHAYFIRALAEAGRSDVLHRVYARDGLGSYGGILDAG